MHAEELYRLIDDPQGIYRKRVLAESFYKLAKPGRVAPNYPLTPFFWEAWIFELQINEKGTLDIGKEEMATRWKNGDLKSYVQKRMGETLHPRTIALYGHLLWQSDKNYAACQAAIGCYLTLAGEALVQISNAEKKFINWRENIEPALALAVRTNNLEALDKEVIMCNQFFTMSVPLWMKSHTAAFVVANLKKHAHRFSLNEFVEEVLALPVNQGNSTSKDIYETARNADKLLGNLRLGKLYERQADMLRFQANTRKNDPSGIVVIPWYTEAMFFYQKAQSHEKYLTTGEELTAFKKQRKDLSVIPVNLIAGHLYEYVESIVAAYTGMKINDALYWLSTDTRFLPPLSNEKDNSLYKELFEHFSVVTFDINKNAKKLSSAGKDRHNATFNYNLRYQIFTKQYINGIMQELIKSKKLTLKALDDFFQSNWIGQTEVDDTSPSKKRTIVYDFIRPAIAYYLKQTIKKNADTGSDFILCIDSLVLKFEFLVRQLLYLMDVTTTTIDAKSGESREHYLPELIECFPKGSFNEKDIALIRHMYTKAGLDLRNNIAHGFLHSRSYTSELADMIVWSVIRLGQFKLENIQEV